MRLFFAPFVTRAARPRHRAHDRHLNTEDSQLRTQSSGLRRTTLLLALLCHGAAAQAEVLIRWDHARIPPPQVLGVTTLVVPSAAEETVRQARALGYRVYLEIEGSAIGNVPEPPAGVAGVIVTGTADAGRLRELARRLAASGVRVLAADARARWPHIRSSTVTRNGDVLQVSARSAQPWIETNAALAPLRRMEAAEPPTILRVEPPPRADGAELDEYLLAIAEAGSFRSPVVLSLAPALQRDLAEGTGPARADWASVRESLRFEAANSGTPVEPLVNVGIAASEPLFWFDVLNLLARHNVTFQLLDPASLQPEHLAPFDLLIVLDADRTRPGMLLDYARQGRTLVVSQPRDEGARMPWRQGAPAATPDERPVYEAGRGRVIELPAGPGNPDAFALWIRQLLGRDRRVLDVWNGITIVATPFVSPDSGELLVTLLNYAARSLPVQLRVRGTFASARFESPGAAPILLPCTSRNGFTELVIPALRIGGHVILRSGDANR